MGHLDGKVAIVTGGARGVGRGHALLLAQEGAAVVVNDLGGGWDGSGSDERPAQQVVDEITAVGGKAVANYDDVSDWAGGERMVAQAIGAFGRLDIVVCNAGILRDRFSANMSVEEWDDVIRVHLRGHFVPIRHAAAHWREQTKATGMPAGGRLVLTASESGLYGNGGQLNYAAAKSGIATMAIVLARELEKYGVTANAICPRARTRLTEGTFGAFKVEDGKFDVWDPDNIAPWVAYLCTDDAAHINGQCFVVGGGRVDLVQSWTPIAHIDKGGRWGVDELIKSSEELFGDRPSSPATFPMDIPTGG
jgi:NAD(P)-dependent dehydrogenase (short-subunit alcohol dehydrogenase family)